ncbi:MAG: selenocysteine protein [Proteobacteria bacterium]|nr:selenocysteine protein [Pseudomonadota bacterium]
MGVYGISKHALMITAFVFAMMLIVDFLDIFSKKGLTAMITAGTWRQYAAASFLGATPGCLGAFMSVSLYVHGLLSFGALTGAMIATSGDEAFVMLAKFPGTAMLLFGMLFVLAIPMAWVADKIVKVIGHTPCESCILQEYHPEMEIYQFSRRVLAENLRRMSSARFLLLLILSSFSLAILTGIAGPQSWNWERLSLIILLSVALFILVSVSDHYLKEHIWSHIIKAHLWRVFLWTLLALVVVDIGLNYLNFKSLISNNIPWMFLLGALVAIIPESGPHLVFVLLFAEGLIPFSVLFTSSFVQDGHGMLPLLAFTVKDSILIKILNVFFGLGIGMILYSFGW